jgi:imidazolonepropionase-like amidohydrolase
MTRALLCSLLLPAAALAHDLVPGTAQSKPVLLRGGDLYTISQGVLSGTDLLFENGKITKLGKNLAAPAGADIVDVRGKRIYPGLIAPATVIGLRDIDMVRATLDDTEVGRIRPEISAHIAYNPDSELIPTVRNHGIAVAQIAPAGSMLRGRSFITNLDGWTKNDSAVRLVDGMFLAWPAVAAPEPAKPKEAKEGPSNKQKAEDERIELRRAFEDARAYGLAKKAGTNAGTDLRWEAMIPVLEKTQPLYVVANDARQIREAVDFAKSQNVRMILVGGAEAHRAAAQLAEAGIPVILREVLERPLRQDDAYDLAYRLPALLHAAGVKFCLSNEGSWQVRNLPLQAGQAVAYGLPQDVALRAITLSTAEILGVDDELGSLDVGKRATLFVQDADPIDNFGAPVERMWIDGREVDLDDRQKRLWEKYRKKP